MPKTRFRSRTLFMLLGSLLFVLSAPTAVFAGIVTTGELVDAQQVEAKRERIHDMLAREEVRKALVNQGVDIAAAQERVAHMSNSEIQTLAANIDQLPAGGALSTLEIVLLIIIILILI